MHEDPRKKRLLKNLAESGITDLRVLEAMGRIPRDSFLPDQFKAQAWEDTALPIGLGQTISQPWVVAMMTQSLVPDPHAKVLEIGTGCGYQTAILSKLFRRIYTIERLKPLLVEAEKRLYGMRILNVTALAADGMKGWPEQAPFKRIIVTAAAPEDRPPAALWNQLAVGGIMVIPMTVGPLHQVLARLVKAEDGSMQREDICPVRFVPLLPLEG